MARRDEIQYIRYYEVGTAARKLELAPVKKKRPLPVPKAKPEPKVITFDPVAIFGTAVAVVMILCVLIGFAQVNRVNDQIVQMEQTISQLKSVNYEKQKEYDGKVDLDEIRAAADAMGLVPVEQVRHVTISVPEPVVEETPGWWETFWQNFLDMF